MLVLNDNYIRKFRGYTDLSQLFFITMGNNCLVSQYLPNDTVTWLNNNVTHDTWSSQNASCPVVTFCDYVTDVPVAECQALLNIYNTTGGASWSNKTNW